MDDDDVAHFNKQKWYVGMTGYGRVNHITTSSNVLLHRVILGLSKGDGTVVDHRNNNPQDNQRSNLRIVTQTQNTHNSKLGRNNTSGVKGVRYIPRIAGWQGRLCSNGTTISKVLPSREMAESWVKVKREVLHGEYHHHG